MCCFSTKLRYKGETQRIGKHASQMLPRGPANVCTTGLHAFVIPSLGAGLRRGDLDWNHLKSAVLALETLSEQSDPVRGALSRPGPRAAPRTAVCSRDTKRKGQVWGQRSRLGGLLVKDETLLEYKEEAETFSSVS